MFEFLKRGGRNGETVNGMAADQGPLDPGQTDNGLAVLANDTPIDAPPARARRRPSIGLALGGGAARGFAHIGVLRTLIANGLKPDVISGTSIGAVVAGCYAAGRLDDFEEWTRSLTRRRLFGYLDVSLTGSGLIGGSRLAERLYAELGTITFDELPLRLVTIATEIGTGHEIWLTRGRVVDALRASYALPGVFAPVRVGGRWLMDGALVNPVPVSAARALGSRLVIGVNLNADLIGRGTTIASFGSDEPDETPDQAPQKKGGRADAEQTIMRRFFGSSDRPGFSTVMMEAFNIMQDRITRARLAGDPPDLMINPRLGRIGLIDFHQAADSIEIGAEATKQALDSIGEVIAALA